MKKISTSFGEFTIGEEVVVTMHGLCNRKYIYKGTVEGKRECMGRDYLVMKGNDGYLYDISTINASSIATGEEAKNIWAAEHGDDTDKKDDKQQVATSETHQQTSSRYNRV